MAMGGFSESENRIVHGMVHIPLASAADIAAFHRLTQSGVYARLRALRGVGLVESVSLGLVCPPVERFFLTELALREMGLGSATWHQPGGLIRLLERLSSVEALYQAAAAVQGLGELQDFQWTDGISFDACARYKSGWAVFFWVGMLRSEASFAERMQALGNDIRVLATNDPYPRPSQVCCVVWDLWQRELVLRVAMRYRIADWVSIWCIADGNWHGARNVQRGRGWVHQPVIPLTAGRGAWDNRVRESLWTGGGTVDAAGLVGRAMRSIRSAEGPREAAVILRNSATTLEARDPSSEAARIVKRVGTYLESPMGVQEARRVLYLVDQHP